jgi:hypothetical protein
MLGGASDFWLFDCILGRVSEFCLWVLFIFLFPSYNGLWFSLLFIFC